MNGCEKIRALALIGYAAKLSEGLGPPRWVGDDHTFVKTGAYLMYEHARTHANVACTQDLAPSAAFDVVLVGMKWSRESLEEVRTIAYILARGL